MKLKYIVMKAIQQQIKNVAAGDNLLKYYADKRNSLGYFQNCHTASLINFANKVYDNSYESIAADFDDALKCQRVIDKVYGRKL